MPRRAAAGVRPIESDPIYGSKLVQQVINKVMVDGKKSRAEGIVYQALEILSKRTSQDPVPALEESIKQLTPVLEVRSRRVGGSRPAAMALLAIGAIVVVLSLARDLPETHRTGEIGVTHEDAKGKAGTGLFLELVGGGLAVGAGLLRLTRRPDS